MFSKMAFGLIEAMRGASAAAAKGLNLSLSSNCGGYVGRSLGQMFVWRRSLRDACRAPALLAHYHNWLWPGLLAYVLIPTATGAD
jgi:hypothetical protein